MLTRRRHPFLDRSKTEIAPKQFLREQASEVQRWILRLLVNHELCRSRILGELGSDSGFAHALGIKCKVPETPVARSRCLARWSKDLAALDTTSGAIANLPPLLDENTRRLAGILSLSELERTALALLVFINRDALFGRLSLMLDDLSSEAAYEVIGVMLGVPATQAAALFSSQGKLRAAGLISLDHNPLALKDKFDFIKFGLPTDLLYTEVSADQVFKGLFRPAPPSDLTWNDFAHLGRQGELLRELLRSRSAGVGPAASVLLSGPPGVGKTMLARLLAQDLSLECHEISVEDSDGDSIDGEKRLRALLAAREIFKGRRALLVFDELEDVTPPPSLLGPRGVGAARKGWLNSILDATRVSTIFITNRPEALDNAYLRRFDLVVEVPNPPRAARMAIVQRVAPAISPELAGRLLESSGATPAIICRAAQTAEAMRASLPPEAPLDKYIEIAIDGTLQAQGHRLLKSTKAGLPGFYRPAYVNADQNLEDLAEGLVRHGSGRLLLYGPPGTGKSAFARHLAERLDRPLILKRGSDLFSPYVGMTEHKIAAAFGEAIQESAVLVFDEVDSFLASRELAQRNYEARHTNEFLTQLESFEGLLVATTNLVAALDPAALRRFDLKSKFGFLRPEQARALLAEHLAAKNLPPAEDPSLRDLDKIDRLTPGDFAAVARRSRFQSLATPEAWVQALADEVRLKSAPQRGLGFYAAGTLIKTQHP